MPEDIEDIPAGNIASSTARSGHGRAPLQWATGFSGWTTAQIRRPYLAPSAAVLCVILASVAAMGPALYLGATYDEGVHIAAGLQWWTEHRFSYEPLTPPLARIVAAFLPWLWGFHSQGNPSVWGEGSAVLANSGNPALLLFLARAGMLIFLAWSSVMVWLFARRISTPATAAVSVTCFVLLPPIIAHAGIAATDMAEAASFSALIYMLVRYIDAPTLVRAALLGVFGALALLTKFTSIVFFAFCVLGLFAWRRIVLGKGSAWLPRFSDIWRVFSISLPITLLMIFAAYNFRVGSLLWEPSVIGMTVPAHVPQHGLIYRLASLDIFPANELWRGLFDALGRISGPAVPDFMFGKVQPQGSAWFFLLSFILKTPIQFLLLAGVGTALSIRRSWNERNWEIGALGVAALCVMAAATFDVPHLGVRYILCVYVFLAPLAGTTVMALWNRTRPLLAGRACIVALMIWSIATVFVARPDYIGWFNMIAGEDPSWWEAANGDTDWGQYGVFLADALRQRRVTEVKLMLGYQPHKGQFWGGPYHDLAELRRLGMPSFTELEPNKPQTGWIAITKESLRTPEYQWLNRYTPAVKIYYSINVYHLE